MFLNNGLCMSPDEFVRLLFDSYNSTQETPVVGCAHRKRDGGICYIADAWPLQSIHRQTHFSISLQTPLVKQTSRIENFSGGVALVLDDILEKAPEPKVRPTWIIETKPGSQQWGYRFETVLRDGVFFDQMIRGVLDAGLGDPGARNVVRWARLPGSHPVDKQHAAKMLFFDPARRFPPTEQLTRALGVMNLPSMKVRRASQQAAEGAVLHDKLLSWFESTGKLLGRSRDAYEVACPRAHEHSNGNPVAYYWPATADDMKRGFHCHHGHSGNAPQIFEFLEFCREQGGPWVGLTEAPAKRLDLKLDPRVIAMFRGIENDFPI